MKGPEAVSAAGLALIATGVFYIYFYFLPFRKFVESWNEYLESGNIVMHPLVPQISILDFVGTALVCYTYRKKIQGPKSTFECFFSCLMGQYGGTTLTGYLLGQVPPWMMDWSPFTGFLIAWWLTFFCPNDYFYREVLCNRSFLYVFDLVGVFNNGHGVTSWGVDKALLNKFHLNPVEISKSYITCIICGTFSSCGGGILCELLGFYDKHDSYTLKRPPCVFKIGFLDGISRDINRNFLLSIIYYTLVNKTRFLNLNIRMPDVTARGVIIIAQFIQFFLESHFPYFDPLTQVTELTLQLCNVSKVVFPEQQRPMNYSSKSSNSSSISESDGDGAVATDDINEEVVTSADRRRSRKLITPKKLD